MDENIREDKIPFVMESDVDRDFSYKRQTRSQRKFVSTTDSKLSVKNYESLSRSRKPKKKAKLEMAKFTNINSDLQKYKSVISDSKIFHYDTIEIAENVNDRYSKMTMERLVDEKELQESPESRRTRIQMIARQGRLHPANKQYNQGAVSCPPLISPGVLVGYTPAGQRHTVNLNADRPTWFNSEYARMQFDEATKLNAKRMMHDLQTGRYLPDSLYADVERKYFAQKELARNGAVKHFNTATRLAGSTNLPKVTAETFSLLNAEQCLIKLNEIAVVRIDDFPDEVTDHINRALSQPLSPLMFKKHPILLGTIEKLAGQKKHWNVSKSAQALLGKVKALFKVPKSLSFHEFFASEVETFKERTKDMAIYDLIVMTEEPTDLNQIEQTAEALKDNPSAMDAAAHVSSDSVMGKPEE